MFVLDGLAARAAIRYQREIDDIVSYLEGQGYQALLRSMLRGASTAAGVHALRVKVEGVLQTRRFQGVPRPYSFVRPVGDVLFRNDKAFIVHPQGQRLQAWEIRHYASPVEIGTFADTIVSAARARIDGRRLRGMSFDWVQVRQRPERRTSPRRFEEASLTVQPPDYNDEELEQVRLLIPERRAFLLRLAQFGKARAIEATAQVEEQTVLPLIEQGVIAREYLIQCRQDSHVISVVADPQQLADEGIQVRCPVCGRSFRDEVAQEIYTLTEVGRRLLSSSRWMMIRVTDVLQRAGIPREALGWNAVAGEDELDIVTEALGPRVFFELKDREFGLGDAYRFAPRMARYGGEVGVVVTTARVADEAKKFFRRGPGLGDVDVRVVEGEDSVERELPRVVSDLSRIGVQDLVAAIFESVAVNAVPVIEAWMDGHEGQ